MVITFHACIGTTARPSKPLRPIFVELGLVAVVLCLEVLTEVVRLLGTAMTPACFFLFITPGDEFKLAFVVTAVFAFAVSVVPDHAVSAGGFVGWPICCLAVFPWKKEHSVNISLEFRWVRYSFPTNDTYRNKNERDTMSSVES